MDRMTKMCLGRPCTSQIDSKITNNGELIGWSGGAIDMLYQYEKINLKPNQIITFLESAAEVFACEKDDFEGLMQGIQRVYDFMTYVDSTKMEHLLSDTQRRFADNDSVYLKTLCGYALNALRRIKNPPSECEGWKGLALTPTDISKMHGKAVYNPDIDQWALVDASHGEPLLIGIGETACTVTEWFEKKCGRLYRSEQDAKEDHNGSHERK